MDTIRDFFLGPQTSEQSDEKVTPVVVPVQRPEQGLKNLTPREPPIVKEQKYADLPRGSEAKVKQAEMQLDCQQYVMMQELKENERVSKLGWKDWFLQKKYKFPAWLVWSFIIILLIFIIIVIVFSEVSRAKSDKELEQEILRKYGVKVDDFENKTYDPYGGGIRFFQSRDDTGSPGFTLEDRQFGGEKIVIEPLTSTPESPNFSEYYGIEANLKNGSVMIERENFENSSLNMEELMKANKGM